jgi:nucleotide-binding universal stress UspA family protein
MTNMPQGTVPQGRAERLEAFMYKTILVPLDLSKRAEAILPHVEDMALCNDARVILLHVIELETHVLDMTGNQIDLEIQLYNDKRLHAETYLSQRIMLWKEKGIRAEYRIMDGHPVEGIITAADETNADLIAMASHGRGGLALAFYGSVATGLLHRINRPLLLIRSASDEEPHKTGEQEATVKQG